MFPMYDVLSDICVFERFVNNLNILKLINTMCSSMKNTFVFFF